MLPMYVVMSPPGEYGALAYEPGADRSASSRLIG